MSERDYSNIPLTEQEKTVLKTNYSLILEGKLPAKKEYYDEEAYIDMYRYCPDRLDKLEEDIKKDYRWEGTYLIHSDKNRKSSNTSNLDVAKENENEKPIKFWKIPIILIVLFAFSILDLPYGFYTFLRIAVCLLSLSFAFSYYCSKEGFSLLSITAIAIAIMWNPIIPVHLDKETWVSLDVISIVIEIIMLFFSYKVWKNLK